MAQLGEFGLGWVIVTRGSFLSWNGVCRLTGTLGTVWGPSNILVFLAGSRT